MKNKDSNKIKGLQSGVTGLLRKKLCQRQNQYKSVLVDINEYLTSQICSSCQSRTLYTLVNTPSDYPNHSILECKTCGIVWNRDDNASINMLDISNSIWDKLGRPLIFKKRESSQQMGVQSLGS